MSMQAAQVALFAKLFWIWIGLLISVFVFWRLRRIWLKRHPPMAVRVKYSRRLAKRLRDRQAMRLKHRKTPKSRLKLPLEMGVLSFVQNVDKELRNGGKASTCGIHAGI